MKRAFLWVIVPVLFVVAGVYAASRDWRGGSVQPDEQGVRSDQRCIESLAGKNATASDTSLAQGARERQIKGTSQPLELSAEQREKIRSYVSAHPEGRLEQADFTLMIGTGVPQQVPLANLPLELADALGGYTGSKFVIVRDKMAIVDPEVRRIVAVIPDLQ